MRAGLGTAVLNTVMPTVGRGSLGMPESAGGKSTLTSVHYPHFGTPGQRWAPSSRRLQAHLFDARKYFPRPASYTADRPDRELLAVISGWTRGPRDERRSRG